MGIRVLQVEWAAVEPECRGTRYEVLVDGRVEETLAGTQKWIIKEPGSYRVGVRARNAAGASTAELATITHVLLDLRRPAGVGVKYKVQDGQLVATIRWNNSMVFSPSDITLKGYYLNLDQEPTTKKTFDVDFEDHYAIIHNIDETSIDVNFNDTMGWNTEFSLQTFYSGDVSNRTRNRMLFRKMAKKWFLNRCYQKRCWS